MQELEIFQTFTMQVKQRDYHVELNLLFVI